MYSGGEAPKATCHSFTLTSIKGDKSYVTCLTMYEVLGDAAGAAQEKHTQYTIGPSLVVPVCYCLMSRVVCTEFSRAWLLRYARAAKAEQPLMVQRVLKCKKMARTHTHTPNKQSILCSCVHADKFGKKFTEGGEELPGIHKPNRMDIHFVEVKTNKQKVSITHLQSLIHNYNHI